METTIFNHPNNKLNLNVKGGELSWFKSYLFGSIQLADLFLLLWECYWKSCAKTQIRLNSESTQDCNACLSLTAGLF